MSDKVKKGMIVTVCVVVGIVLAVMIAGNFKQPPKAKDKLAESQSTEKGIVKPEIDKKELDQQKRQRVRKRKRKSCAGYRGRDRTQFGIFNRGRPGCRTAGPEYTAQGNETGDTCKGGP